MEHNEIVVNKLDRPVLKNSVKIHGTEKFQIDIGELQYLSQAEKQLLRKKLMGPENNVNDPQLESFGSHPILLSLFILFGIAIAVSCFGSYIDDMRVGTANIFNTFMTWVFLEMIIAIPFAIYLKWHGNYKKSVKRGELKVYQFPIGQKVAHEYYSDFHTIDYYLVIGGAYVSIGKKLYDRVHTGDLVRVAIFRYRGDDYFSLINDWGKLYQA